MELSRQLDKMNAAELRNLTATPIVQLAGRDAERSAQAAMVAKRDAEIKAKQLKIDRVTHEMATLKRWRYDRLNEKALGKSNWLFAGSLRTGQRAVAIRSLIQSAKHNGHDPGRYLEDVLERRATQPARRLQERLPHRWQSTPCCSLCWVPGTVAMKR